MLQQATDLLEEGQDLKNLLDNLQEQDWQRATPFKQWTINEVVEHLHSADKMAVLALTDPNRFQAAKSQPRGANSDPKPPLQGTQLLEAWWSYFKQMCNQLGASEPNRRVPWFGPDMGVMMFTTARQMETWAHAHDIYDLMHQPRTNTDRLKNIAHIGVKTYGWTFANRKLDVPGPAPYVHLTAPSGALWEWNEPSTTNCVVGLAEDFCHVVTQGRNIADVGLAVTGEPAEQWMAIAQCFAGPPEDPPAPGRRVG